MLGAAASAHAKTRIRDTSWRCNCFCGTRYRRRFPGHRTPPGPVCCKPHTLSRASSRSHARSHTNTDTAARADPRLPPTHFHLRSTHPETSTRRSKKRLKKIHKQKMETPCEKYFGHTMGFLGSCFIESQSMEVFLEDITDAMAGAGEPPPRTATAEATGLAGDAPAGKTQVLPAGLSTVRRRSLTHCAPCSARRAHGDASRPRNLRVRWR
jgi:hypothetical protein